jgi:LacI family transcriptional regulator
MHEIPRVILLIERSRSFGRGLLYGISHYTRTNGLWEFCMEPDFYERGRDLSLTWIRSQKADGIIAQTWNPGIVDKILESGLPAVVSGVHPSMDTLLQIKTDDAACGRLAADYLLERGFRSFAFCGFEGVQWSQQRSRSFEHKLSEAGMKPVVYEPVHSKRGHVSGPAVRAIATWLKSLNKPVAVMAANDDRALEIALACKMADLDSPDDVSILGVDDDELICELSRPPLSSIRLSTELAGYRAAEMLYALMRRQSISSAHRKIYVTPLYVVTRNSTDIFAIEDPEVTTAIRYIREHARENISVGDVASEVTLSKRSLQQRFKNIRGHSIHHEIKRVRVDILSRMLLDTHLSISQIAESLQFRDVASLSNWFKHEKGMSPSAFRKKHVNPQRESLP